MTISETLTLRGKEPAAVPMLAFRRSLRLYLQAVGLVMLLLLVVAWSIDLADNFAAVRDKAVARGVGLPTILAPYLFYRSVDIVTRLLPTASFIALFVAEIMRPRWLERVVLSAAGYSPLQGLSAVVAAAVLLGGLQFGLESYWRPAAVFAQVDLGVGQYAGRFARGPSQEVRWFLSADDAMAAKVVSSDSPELRDLELYRGYRDERLREVIVAERAMPLGEDKMWRLYNLVFWRKDAAGAYYASSRAATLDIPFQLRPEQLTYYDIPAFYLPNGALSRIAEMRTAPNIADVDLAIWRRWTAVLLPGAFALLGASLAQMVWTGRVLSPVRVLGFGLCGYAAIVSVKVFWSMGELGSIPASASASLTILLALAGTAVIQAMRS